MKRSPIPVLFSLFACAMTLPQAPAAARGLAGPEAHFVARPNRCAQFLGGEEAVADSVEASYSKALSAVIRRDPGALDRIRAACEVKRDQAVARAGMRTGRPAKSVSRDTHGAAQ